MSNRRGKSHNKGSFPSWVWIALALILLVGGALRIGYYQERVQAPDFQYPLLDAEFHNYWANGLVTGDWSTPWDKPDPHIQDEAFFRPPGYPYALAFLYQVFGHAPQIPLVIQLILGLLNALVAFFIAKRWYGVPAALVFAGFMSFYWVFIYFEGELHAPVFVILLLLVFTFLMGLWPEKKTWPWALASGVVLGLLALFRPNALLLAPAAIGWFLWLGRRRGDTQAYRRGALGMALGIVLALAPSTVRNVQVSGDFIPLTSSLGPNLYMGNNATANGLCDGDLPGYGNFATCYDWGGIVHNVAKETGHPVSQNEASSYLSDRAFGYILKHPGHSLELLGRRFLLFWSSWEPTHNKVIQFEQKNSRTLSLLPLNHAIIVGLALMGLVALWWDRRGAGKEPPLADKAWEFSVLVFMLGTAWFLSIMPFFVASRYRMPILPLLMLFGAYGCVRLVRSVRLRDYRTAGILLVSGLLVMAGSAANFLGYTGDEARWHFDRAICLVNQEQLDMAEEELRATLALKDDHAQAHILLGSIQAMNNQIELSITSLKAGLVIDPGNANAHYILAQALESRGRFQESIFHYEKALTFNPRNRNAAKRLEGLRQRVPE